MISWMISISAAMAAIFFYQRMQRQAATEELEPDEGQAILDFGRAFPEEAIRAIHPTLDGHAFFVRLHDGKAGFMLLQGRHYICHMMTPGKVAIDNAPSGRGLKIAFADFAYLDGVYEFADAQTAAEVSLWILGSFRSEMTGSTPTASE